MNVRHRLLLLAVVLCFTAAVPQAAEPLLFYGYYHAQTPTFGFLMDQVADFTNVVILDIARYENEDDLFDATIGIPRALELGYNIILDVNGYLGRATALSPEVSEQQLGLLSLKLRQAGYLRPQGIFAIFLMDEPWNQGISVEDQELALEMVHRYFPGFPTMINYSLGELRSPVRSIPEALDIVSYDAYFFWTNQSDLSRPALEAYLESGMSEIRRKAPGKPVFLIGQSFQLDRLGYFMPTHEQLDWYVDYSLSTPEMIGHLWFLLGSRGSQGSAGGLQGAIDFPDRLEHQRVIGLTLMPGLIQPQREGLLLGTRPLRP